MTDFDYWQDWGRNLSDADFARAWIALGVAAGSRVKRPASEGYVGLLERDPAAAPGDVLLDIAKSALGDALSAAREYRLRVRWSFPAQAATVDADGRFPLARIDPASWAKAWQDVSYVIREPPRLRVTDVPEREPITPWYRLLLEAAPAPGAVSVVFRSPEARLALEWPLRLAALPDNGAADIVSAALEQWPSTRLARGLPIDRSNANCDVLLHQGRAEALLRTLRSLPFHCKANLVVLVGMFDPDPDLFERLRDIAAATCASGIVLQSFDSDAKKLGQAWNRFVEEVSHDVTLDRALHVGARSDITGDVVICLTEAAADFQLHSLAERLTARVRELPAGSTLDISRLNAGWVRSKPPRWRGAESAPEASPVHADSSSIEFDPGRLSFEAESAGASELAILSTAVDAAAQPQSAEARRAARYLQQQSFVKTGREYVEAKHGFVAGQRALVRVGIGPPQKGWQSLRKAFPQEALPAGKQWRLTVWLTESAQLAKPLRGTLILPSEGPTEKPCEFRFAPPNAGRFEGRITVLHRGRVLQTAILRASVMAAEAASDEQAAPELQEFVPVRHRLGDLDRRRQFDLAFVTNHTVTGEPRGVALADDRAWIADVTKSLEVTKDINTSLSRVARSVADYADGIAGEEGGKLLVELAKQGAWLQVYLVGRQLRNPRNRPDIAEKEYIQIVSTRSDATVPFEFIYDYAVPDDDAKPCPQWREGLTQGACRADCKTGDSKLVCPMGFWGLRKVIERHQVSPEHASDGKEFFLQSETGRETDELSLGGTALLASSTRVTDADLQPVARALAAKLGTAPQTPKTWSAWASAVGQAKPRFLLALPHTDGTGANVTLEIGGDTISTIQVKPTHLRPTGEVTRPLVALLGCDVAGTANDYGEHVVVFRERGAAIVIGTIATVFGGHAASVAKLLAETLIPDGAPPQRLGEAIRALKRRALLDGLLMPLCVVAYGDADWRLVK